MSGSEQANDVGLGDGASRPISVLTVSTLFPNPAQPNHGIFVETRLRKVLATRKITSHVLAPIAWLPPLLGYKGLGPTRNVPGRILREGLTVEHPRYVVVPKIGMNVAPRLLYLAMRRRLQTLLDEGRRFDLIDAHYFYPDGVAATWLAKTFGLPVVVTARGTDINLISNYPTPRRLIQRAAANANALITVSAALKDKLITLGVKSEKIVVLRNGVDLERFHPIDRVAMRTNLGLTRPALASVGHLIERKGHHIAIGALPCLPGIDLLIVGNGPERQSLETLASSLRVRERVRFLSPMSQDRLKDIYGAVDALVLPSSAEGWPNVLLEAMACGTPVVASSIPGTREVVTRPEAGRLMRSLDARGLADAVDQLLSAPPPRADTRRYAQSFDWWATTEGQLRIFRKIAAQGQTKHDEAE